MSGLLLRSHMNAGQDGFRDTGPKHQGGLDGPKGFSGGGILCPGSIDHTICYYLASRSIAYTQ